MIKSILLAALLPVALAAHALHGKQPPAPNSDLLMCNRGELLFSEDFDPKTVSERWFYRGEFALRDRALVRTEINPEENQRVFLKNPKFYNTIIQFDFKFAGQTANLRLVMGSGGHYNSITEIRRGHFQVNTPDDRAAGIVPSHLGECAFTFEPGTWHTMTVEYWGNEIVAHVDADRFVLGSHPIIDRTREYFAFQFDRPSAAIDNVRVWAATGQRKDWTETRARLTKAQQSRTPIERDPLDRYQYVYTNVKSRLALNDEKYRELVQRHADLQKALHARYPEAFKTHKELQKTINDRKQQLRQSNATFKKMENAINAARRAEDAWVVAQTPRLKDLPKHRIESELGLARAALESQQPVELAALVAGTARLEAALERRYPDAFASVDAALAKQKETRELLNADAEFQKSNRAVADAWQAIRRYEENAEPGLAALEKASKAAAR
jgi:hypothetical protein